MSELVFKVNSEHPVVATSPSQEAMSITKPATDLFDDRLCTGTERLGLSNEKETTRVRIGEAND